MTVHRKPNSSHAEATIMLMEFINLLQETK